MKTGMRKSSAFVTALIVSFSVLLLPLFHSDATTEASVSLQSADQQVIARVGVKDEYRRNLLARPGIDFLNPISPEDQYILTTRLLVDQLRAEGWAVQVLYETDENGKWRSLIPTGACVYTIMPTDRAFADAGGTSSFDLTTEPDCDWVAISTAPWILINGVPQGQGSVTISYTVLPNDTPTRREGAIFIAGQGFSIFQGALFDDVPQSHPFYLQIGKISGRGITQGCSATSFCPGLLASRGQMAAFIIRSLGELNPPDPAMQRFADVPPTHPFYNFIDRMAELGITLGCGGGNYCPGDAVTREQMAAFIIRALGEFDPPEPATQRFADVPPTNPFYRFIDRLAELGITQGCAPGLYCPSDPVTRGQTAAFLVRAFNL
jgi:hypothetical protein